MRSGFFEVPVWLTDRLWSHSDETLMSIHFPSFVTVLLAIGAASVYFAPRSASPTAFFAARDEHGQAPGAWALTLSQVTTWIFARSLLNAGILGYFFGIAGALAYTAYYGSFLTGWVIIKHLRFHHGAKSVQGFLSDRFGHCGTVSYNILVSLRLLTEVFANLLVVGLVFSAWSPLAADVAIFSVAAITLCYSMTGGLRAAIQTDVWQALMLSGLIGVLGLILLVQTDLSIGTVLTTSAHADNPGWLLLAVALLQVLSYPLHDPVMMDRGFLSDRESTRRSFLHAFWLSAMLIFAFGLIGVVTGVLAADAGDFLEGLGRVLGAPAMFIVGLALMLSAISTMDSTFSSVAKLVAVDSGLMAPTTAHGRMAMAAFAVFGLFLVYVGTDDLFAAVAVSGTASLFLTPVIIFCILGDRHVARWSLLVTVAIAVCGALLYFLESSGHTSVLANLTGLEHKYAHLLCVTLFVIVVGLCCFAAGVQPRTSSKKRCEAEFP